MTENIKTEAYKVRGRLKAMELSIEEDDDKGEGQQELARQRCMNEAI